MSNLRTLTVDKVRRYHEEYYTPDNTILILTGNVKEEDFFNALDEVEALILQRRGESAVNGGGDGSSSSSSSSSRVGRPWVASPLPTMNENTPGVYPPYTTTSQAINSNSSPLTISFPSEDESRGTISIAWRGPPYDERSQWAHLSLVWDYLTDSAASPLQLAFVENDDPLCADIGPAHDVFTGE